MSTPAEQVAREWLGNQDGVTWNMMNVLTPLLAALIERERADASAAREGECSECGAKVVWKAGEFVKAIETAEAERDSLKAAVARLAAALREVDRIQNSDAVKSVYLTARMHCGPYGGENWRETVDAALADPTVASIVSESQQRPEPRS